MPRVDGFEQSAAGVAIGLVSGRGQRGSASGDLLIGADGIHSTVRAKLYPDEGRLIWNGVMLWRGCTPWPKWRDGRTMAIAGGNFSKFVFYSVGREDGGTGPLTNWAVMARTGGIGASPPRNEGWSRPGVLTEALRFVQDRFRLDFVDPAAIIKETRDLYEYPNCDRDPLPRWSFGRVTLLADAAHPMFPVGSNGASQAIVDALHLADQLDSGTSVEAALRSYDVERRPPTEKIILANREGGPERVIDLVEVRAPSGFHNVDDVASYDEREAIVPDTPSSRVSAGAAELKFRMHVAKKPRCDAEAALKGVSQPRGWKQTNLSRHRLQRNTTGQQHAGGVEPCDLHEPRRCLAGCSSKFAVEGALGHPDARGEQRNLKRLVQIGLYPADEVSEWTGALYLRLQERAELRLVSRTPCVEDQPLGDFAGNRGIKVVSDHGERHVDAGGHPR